MAFLLLPLLASSATAAPATISPQAAGPATFAFSNTLGDSAVLQNPITIWGTGTPHSTVATVAVGGAQASTKVGADGVWRQPLRLAESLEPVTISST
eukprot:SAG22_NODE_13214_length_414_cov_1.028571_1_plen_96_part_10